MPAIEFNEEKNTFLKETRGINFEDILEAIDKGGLLDDIKHPNKKYSQQRIFVVKVNNYAYAAPYIQDKQGTIFLKTLYPSRVFTESYLKKRYGKNKK